MFNIGVIRKLKNYGGNIKQCPDIAYGVGDKSDRTTVVAVFRAGDHCGCGHIAV